MSKKKPRREDKPLTQAAKIAGGVFDDKTVEVLVELLNKHVIDGIDFPVSGGKEAIVFRCRTQKGFVALKIFKYENTSFHRMREYILGDPRFRLKHSLRENVKLWAKKEYANLQTCFEAGVSVPKPLFWRDNIVVMEYLGENGVPYALLEEVVLKNPQKVFDEVVSSMKKMHAAGIVHADLSSFNIVMKNNTPVFIDFGQAVVNAHPNSRRLFEQDCENIAEYFQKLGVKTSKDDLMQKIITKEQTANPKNESNNYQTNSK